MKNVKVLALGAAVAGVLMSGVTVAGVTANAALTSNYVWRGVTQTDDGLAVQAGADWANESGFSAGVWGSNVDFIFDSGIEYDIYGGYAGTAGDFSYNAGVIRYGYSGFDADLDVTEIYVGGGFGPVSASYYTQIDPSETDSGYFTISFKTEVSGVGINPYFGSWSGDVFEASHFGVVASKNISGFDLSATVDVSDEDLADDTYFFVMAKKTFEL